MIRDSMRVEFNMDQHMCKNCKKNSPEYHELQVQIRFKFFEGAEALENIKVETHKLIYSNFNEINKFVESEWGFDIYFRSKEVLNKVSSVFQRKYLCDEIRTKKIVGRDSLTMKDIWRHVLLVNIVNLHRGDKVNIKGIEYYIKALNKNTLVLRECIKGDKKVLTYSVIKDYIKLIQKDAINWKTNTLKYLDENINDNDFDDEDLEEE